MCERRITVCWRSPNIDFSRSCEVLFSTVDCAKCRRFATVTNAAVFSASCFNGFLTYNLAATSLRRGCTSLKRRQDVGRTSTGRCQDVATTSPRRSDIKRDRQKDRQTDRQTHGHSLSLIVSDTPTNCRVYLQRLTDSKTLLFAVVYNSLQCE